MFFISERAFLFSHRVSQAQIRRVNMKAMLALLFIAAMAVYARAEMEYHPQAILHYLEMEDQEIAKKVRNLVKLDADGPSFRPSFDPSLRPSYRPSGFPTGMPPAVKRCLIKAVVCHKRAGDDACAHLKCIKDTGGCLHYCAEVSIHDLPPPMKKCLPIIPCCLLGSKTCEEKLCCFVRFGECLKRLGDAKDAE